MIGHSHFDRKGNDAIDYQSQQPHIHTRLLGIRGYFQGDDTATSGEHKASATRTGAAHEQPPRVVRTHTDLIAPRTNRKRSETLVPNSKEV